VAEIFAVVINGDWLSPSGGGRAVFEFIKAHLQIRYDRRAVTALEYGLLASVLIGSIWIGFQAMGNALSNKFSGIGTSL
jgi:Flp pilus assembly pilin Flp